MGNAFEVADPFPGVSGSLRRSLSLLDLEAPSVKKLSTAVGACGLKPKVPFWMDGKSDGFAVAHVGIPEAKAVIFTVSNVDTKRVPEVRAAWESFGYRCLVITRTVVDLSSHEKLAADLAEIVKPTKKGKKK